MRPPLWPPDEGDKYTERLVDIMSDRRPSPRGRLSSILDGYRAVVFEEETEYVRPGPLGPDYWWPTAGRSRTLWTCEHDHPTEAEAVTCAYERLVACWPGQ